MSIRSPFNLNSPLKRVLGHGAAKDGVHHWWLQRLTSVALVPLTVWFAISLLRLPQLDYVSVSAWLQQGWSAVLLILLVLVAARHSQLGVQVVVEDYVHSTGGKAAVLILSNFAHVLLAAAGVLAVLRVVFGVAQ